MRGPPRVISLPNVVLIFCSYDCQGLQVVLFLFRHSITCAKQMSGALLEAVAARADGVSTQYQELSLKGFATSFTYVLAFASYVDYTQTISHGPTNQDIQVV